jgi:hypothetical protein
MAYQFSYLLLNTFDAWSRNNIKGYYIESMRSTTNCKKVKLSLFEKCSESFLLVAFIVDGLSVIKEIIGFQLSAFAAGAVPGLPQ